ncbi:MAG: transposase [Muribaculaceae bacterium]|nr:transposase [Muribaculaceae bacterium]
MTVFGVKYRLGLINPEWEKELHSVIANALKKIDGVMPIEVGGYRDHIHMLYSTQGKVSERDIMSRVKIDSSKWVNRNRLCVGRFGWQDGGGHFSYSQGQIETVRNYIRNQAEHHRVVSFREEYEAILKRAGIEIDPFNLPDELT